MRNGPMHAGKANRAIGKWAYKLPALSHVAKHVLILTAMLVTIALMAAPSTCAESQWLSPHYQDHPLAGTIWTSDFKPVTAEQLETAVLESKFVLLGETHNNPDHHRLQAQMIEALVRAGRRPAVIWEMIPASLQAELDRHLQNGSKDASKLGAFLQWEERGWPDWAMYRPIAEAALSADLPLRGGALDRETSQAISQSDPSQARLIMDLGLDQPVKPEIVEAEATAIRKGHCNLLPEAAVNPMIMAQRAADAHLAKIALAVTPKDGAVLIAGSGHVRKDWAVPSFIRQTSPGASVISVAFFEVDPKRSSPSEYVETNSGSGSPYDFIYFTPKADLIDRCAEMAKQIKTMKPKT